MHAYCIVLHSNVLSYLFTLHNDFPEDDCNVQQPKHRLKKQNVVWSFYLVWLVFRAMRNQIPLLCDKEPLTMTINSFSKVICCRFSNVHAHEIRFNHWESKGNSSSLAAPKCWNRKTVQRRAGWFPGQANEFIEQSRRALW